MPPEQPARAQALPDLDDSRAYSEPCPMKSTWATGRGRTSSRLANPSLAAAAAAAYGTLTAGRGRPAMSAMAANRPASGRIDAPEEVPLAADASLVGERMSPRDIADVDEIEARRGEYPRISARDAGDHPPGGRRLVVAVADRRRRIDDHRVEAVGAASSTARSASSFVLLYGTVSSHAGGASASVAGVRERDRRCPPCSYARAGPRRASGRHRSRSVCLRHSRARSSASRRRSCRARRHEDTCNPR